MQSDLAHLPPTSVAQGAALTAGLRRALASLAAAVRDPLGRHRLAQREAEVTRLQAELEVLRSRSEELAQTLREEARTDPLTGLGNRRRWEEQVEIELERARRLGSGLAVALVDLDRFKEVNDTRGHAAGDRLLRDVAEAFAGAVRSIDLVARIGGEEFAVALPTSSLEDAVHIVERLRTSVPSGITCSAGLALWTGSEDAGELLARADGALYRAKTTGRDRLTVAGPA